MHTHYRLDYSAVSRDLAHPDRSNVCPFSRACDWIRRYRPITLAHSYHLVLSQFAFHDCRRRAIFSHSDSVMSRTWPSRSSRCVFGDRAKAGAILISIRQETLARWEEVEVGKTVDNDRVVEWLETWGGDSQKARPRC